MRLGFTTWSMASIRAEESIPRLAALGFDSIELSVALGWRDALDLLTPERRRRIKRLLREFGLALPAIAANAYLLPLGEAELDDEWRRLTGAVDLAVEWAGPDAPPAVDTYLGGQPGELGERRAAAIERLGALCDYASARGVVVALQPHMDGALGRLEDVLPLIDAVDRGNLWLTIDVNDFTVQGYGLEETVDRLGPRAVLAHVKDERGRRPEYSFLVPGAGDFDYARCLRALAAAGFDGDVCAEVSLRLQREPGFDPFEAAAQSYRVLAGAFELASIRRG